MIQGKVLKYNADDINTDVIWPGKYTYIQIQPEKMSEHALENFDPEFKEKVKEKRIMVVGKNFGCGSSREQAAECLKYSGVKAVIAKSFARIYYRNAINLGFVVIESEEASDKIKDGDKVEIDLNKGIIKVNDKMHINFPKFPEFVMELIENDGLINMIRKKNGLEKIAHEAEN